MFIFALIWSLGAPLNTDSRKKFDYFVRKLLVDGITEEERMSMGLLDTVEPPGKEYAILLPDKESCFNYKFITDKELDDQAADGGNNDEIGSKSDENGNRYWEPWSLHLAAAPPIARDVMFNEIIVETVDTIRFVLLLTSLFF